MRTSLAKGHPELLKEWHKEKNDVSPEEITTGSGIKVWWICSNGHEWMAAVYRKVSLGFGKGCPYCANKKICYENSLQASHAELCKEWDYKKNTKTPEQVSAGSGLKIWWKCIKGHEWEVAICDRTLHKTKCPYCMNRKICNENCLATRYPELIPEWHPKNDITPYDIFPGSTKKVWWLCEIGHEWHISPNARTSSQRACPFCSGHKTCKSTSLATTHPYLTKQWHPRNDITPSQVSHGCNKTVWWICDKGHEWQAIINCRARGNGCPYCSNRFANKENCLATIRPDIASEWHPDKNTITTFDVVPGSNEKAWWICDKGHEWETIISNRTKGNGCPYCTNQKICNNNCLLATHPDLVKNRWDFTKNKISPSEITYGTQKKAWWICPKGHSYEMSIRNATMGRECPLCKHYKRQKAVFNIIKDAFPNYDVLWNYKHQDIRFKKSNRPIELDIFVPELNLAIEYQGKQHYKPIPEWGGEKELHEIQSRDTEKRAACKKANITLIEIDYKWDGEKKSVLELLPK